MSSDPSAPRGGEPYLEPYRAAIREHGPSFEATLWSSREAQRIRFDVMIDMAGFDDCAVVDAGCGPGEFAQRLLERDVAFTRYVGLDALQPMIDAARSRGLDPLARRVSFEVVDLVAQASQLARYRPDFVCFSGTLNTMDEPCARWLVAAAFASAARGVVFNFLSDRCPAHLRARNLHPARRFDTLGWLDWSLTRTNRVAFRQEYLDGHDATIMLLHEAAAAAGGPAGTR